MDDVVKEVEKKATKLQYRKINSLSTAKAEREFASAICDYANSEEFRAEARNYDTFVKVLQEMMEPVSEIPMAALYQYLQTAERILKDIIDEYAAQGLSERFFWLTDLFYVCESNIQGLRLVYDYEFDKVPYPEDNSEKYTGVGIDRADREAYVEQWMENAQEKMKSIYEALDGDDMSLQNMHISDLFSLALETAYVCGTV